MEDFKKNILLQNCNNLERDQIIAIVQKGEITLDEFRKAGLSQQIINSIADAVTSKEKRKKAEADKNALMATILSGKISADKIKVDINNGLYVFEDLLQAGVDQQTVNSLKHYCNANRITIFKDISQLPPMEEGRTDVYFVGVPGSGKSTMLAGLLNVANKNGVLMPDTYNNDGSVYQAQLITDLNRGVLPNATASGSYNYVAMSLKDGRGDKHPFNIVEVPGENYVNMFNNGDVSDLLNYIKNGNKKILIFVVDSLAHDTGYESSSSQLDQSLVYVNILNMFKSNRVLEQTDAIYLVANKFDAIMESRFSNETVAHDTLAYSFLEEEFKNLIENCKDARNDTKNKFKIKVLPYSIGNVSFSYVVNGFDKVYSENVVNNLIEDSFVVKGSRFKIFG